MKKINNKILIAGLAVLIAVFVFSRVFRSPKLESNLRRDLVKLDTAQITEVRLIAQGEQAKMIKLAKEGSRWSLTSEEKKYEADQNSVKSMLTMLNTMEAERMVSRKKEKWEEFNVGDKATQVSVYYGSDKEADLRIGKTGFNQSQQPANPYGGGGFSPYTYVRLSDEDEVYVVNGFLESNFNRTVSDWRDKSFLRIPKDLVTKITFTYPGDSSFIAEKRDTLWYSAGQPADQARIDSYLSQLSYKNLTTFADDFNPSSKANVVIQIEGAGSTIGTIEAWQPAADWILRSSLQPTVYFSGSGSNVNKDLFVSAKKFLKQ